MILIFLVCILAWWGCDKVRYLYIVLYCIFLFRPPYLVESWPGVFYQGCYVGRRLWGARVVPRIHYSSVIRIIYSLELGYLEGNSGAIICFNVVPWPPEVLVVFRRRSDNLHTRSMMTNQKWSIGLSKVWGGAIAGHRLGWRILPIWVWEPLMIFEVLPAQGLHDVS